MVAANKFQIIADHEAIYANPISVKKGDVLELTGREDMWEGYRWLWAKSIDGREGWVPDDLPLLNEGETRCRYDYSAVELSVKIETMVTVLNETHGWVWCLDRQGLAGWVPRKCLGGEPHLLPMTCA